MPTPRSELNLVSMPRAASAPIKTSVSDALSTLATRPRIGSKLAKCVHRNSELLPIVAKGNVEGVCPRLRLQPEPTDSLGIGDRYVCSTVGDAVNSVAGQSG